MRILQASRRGSTALEVTSPGGAVAVAVAVAVASIVASTSQWIGRRGCCIRRRMSVIGCRKSAARRDRSWWEESDPPRQADSTTGVAHGRNLDSQDECVFIFL